ncbi:OmpA family protein [Hyphococcus sp.]|uniref:OmpA family protein n=1 Tax=Hyphococcus sp. TaxID=2038636 RepID=UPI00208B5E3D|nr:MAG: hypothetical protein DHS20C04_25390 [Marinicaulis sp.]
MTAFLKFLIAFALVALLGFCAWWFDAAPGSLASAQLDLERSARTAIGSEDAAWASVRMDGQKAILSGEAPTEQRRDALIARVAATQWSGGLALGGVTAIDSRGLTVASATPVAAPYTFIVEHEGDVISFSGSVPDQASRDRLFAIADELFSDVDVTGELDLAEGAPVSPADWTRAAQTSLRALSHLRRGVVQAEDKAFRLTGEAEDETRSAAARSLLDSLPDGLAGSATITIRPAPASIEDIIAQSDEAVAEPIDSTTEETESAIAEQTAPAPPNCLALLEDAIAAHKVGFDSARADIDNASREHLRDIAALLPACPAARLRITGHTDASGNAARNRQLSGYRADAVRAFLISVGAPADRLSTRGAGSSEPVAENRTAAGREKNRRIEIEIIKGE